MYTDNSNLTGPDPKGLDKVLQQMCKVKLGITEEGTLEDFLGVNINLIQDGTINLTQPHLIYLILKDLNLLGPNVKTKDIPA